MRPSALASPGGCEMWMLPSRFWLELKAHAVQHGRILLKRGQIFVVDDRRRHVPCRIDGDVFHRFRQFRRGVLARLSDDDARGPDLLAPCITLSVKSGC
jgi:hypothetical protein